MKFKYAWLLLFCWLSFFSCTVPDIREYSNVGKYPDIFPNYIDVTVPYNIAPLNFRLQQAEQVQGILKIEGGKSTVKVASSKGNFLISPRKWEKLMEENKGEKLQLTVFEKEDTSWKKYDSFSIHISADPIDSYLVYRLIEPGYKLYNKMGIYQRNLENYKETPVYENKMTGYNCVNCHSFCMQNPNKMMFHMRGENGGTLLMKNNVIEKLNTKTDSTISSLVYPYWHPTGRFIAFSVNKINQVFYLNNRNRIEVYDSESDVVIYDTQKQDVFTNSLLSDKNRLETFPSFSPDGKTLYFCTAKTYSVPDKSDSVKYSLCSISFSSETQGFGEKVDTILNAEVTGKSVAFPRISPDGRFLLFTVCDYGSFPIWHKEADLCLFDLQTKKTIELSKVNSPDVDSYHSWSSNSRWFIFSSRRVDGLYTWPFIAHVGEDGEVGKAFMLPQKNPAFYDAFMKSYNIPELVKAKVDIDSYQIANEARSAGFSIKFKAN